MMKKLQNLLRNFDFLKNVDCIKNLSKERSKLVTNFSMKKPRKSLPFVMISPSPLLTFIGREIGETLLRFPINSANEDF